MESARPHRAGPSERPGGAEQTVPIRMRRPPGFAQVPNDLATDPRVKAGAFRLWVVLSGWAFQTAVPRRDPSRADLAEMLNVKSRRSVDEYVANLEQTGWLTVERRKDPRSGGWTTSLFILEWEPQERGGSPAADPDSTPDAVAGEPAETAPDPQHNEPIIAGQSEAQKSAPRPRPAKTVPPATVVDSTVDNPDRGAEICTREVQKSAPPNKERDLTTEEKQPPRGATDGGPGGPLVVVGQPGDDPPGSRASPGAVPGASDPVVLAIAAAVQHRLPDRLRRQVSRMAIRRACEPLVAAGVTAEVVDRLATEHDWTGAGPGAVIVWLRGDVLAAIEDQVPPRPAAAWPPWCGECDDPHSRWVPGASGSGVARCPRCHPRAEGRATG